MNPTLIAFDIIKYLPLIAIMIIASHQDYKTGEAKNKLWLYTPIGLTLTITELILFPQLLPLTIASIIIGVVIALGLFQLGGWHGADTKAFIMITLSTPLTPAITILTIAPIITLVISSIAALPLLIIKHQKTIRFLPYMTIGLIASAFF